MPGQTLPPDPDSESEWKNLPQTTPTKQAMPPASGGLLQIKSLLILILIVAIVGWILTRLAS